MAAPHRVLALALVPCLGFACNLLLGHEPGYWIGGDAGGAAGQGGQGVDMGAAAGRGGAAGSGGESSCPQACLEVGLPTEGLALWLAADHGVVAGQEGVHYWQDRSGRAHHAAQSVADARPRVLEAASGLPLVDFDGAGDHLRLPVGFASFAGAAFFLVAEADPNAGCAGILSFANGNYADDIEFGRHTPNLLYYEVLSDPVNGAADGFEAGRLLQASILHRADTTVELRIDGVITGTGQATLPAAVERTQNFVGKNTYMECPTTFDGRIGELLLYTRELSPEETDQVEEYLRDKWGLGP